MKFTSDKVKRTFAEDMAQAEQTARPQEDSMVIDVIRKNGKRTENDNIKALMSLGVTDDINQCNIYVDAPEVQNMTREDLEALEENWNTIQMLSKEEKNCEHYVDDLLPNREKTIAELEKQQDLTYEKVVHPEKNVRPNSVAKFLADKDKLESSCHPYELCLAVLRKNELCFLDTYDEGATLCRFNGKYWKPLKDKDLTQIIYNILSKQVKQGVNNVDMLVNNVASYVRREIQKSYDDGKKRFHEKDYVKIQNRIVFDNCVFDVKTGEKLNFSSTRPYAYQIKCAYVDKDLPTPCYNKLKWDATGGDPMSMLMIDYMVAYLLMPNRTGKCFFVMSPARDSGKNVLGEFIEKCFDKTCTQTIDIEFLGSNRFSSAGFDTARLLTCLEMPVKPLTTAAVKELKTFTGNSTIVVEEKYVRRMNAQVNFKVLLATNGGVYLPSGEMDEAFYRRVIAIPFVCSTPMDKLIFNLSQKLEGERSAIVSKCVRKFGKIISDDGGVTFPESALSKTIKAGWMGKSNFNECFVATMLEYTAYDDDAIPKKDLEMVYDAYYMEKSNDGIGYDKPVRCSRDMLIKVIQSVYPNIRLAKRRRGTILEPENGNGIPCIIGLRWTAKAQEIITQCKNRTEHLSDAAEAIGEGILGA